MNSRAEFNAQAASDELHLRAAAKPDLSSVSVNHAYCDAIVLHVHRVPVRAERRFVNSAKQVPFIPTRRWWIILQPYQRKAFTVRFYSGEHLAPGPSGRSNFEALDRDLMGGATIVNQIEAALPNRRHGKRVIPWNFAPSIETDLRRGSRPSRSISSTARLRFWKASGSSLGISPHLSKQISGGVADPLARFPLPPASGFGAPLSARSRAASASSNSHLASTKFRATLRSSSSRNLIAWSMNAFAQYILSSNCPYSIKLVTMGSIRSR